MQTTLSVAIADLRTCFALLTRLPVHAQFDRTAAASWGFPVAGLVVGLIAAVICGLCLWLQMPPALTACFALTALIIPTGALHEDGLADCADGFWGGFDRPRRLEIMRDSRIGTYGVLALVLALLIQAVAMITLMADGALIGPLIASAVLSRAGLPAMMTLLPQARSEGLSVQTGRPSGRTSALSAALGFVLAAVCVGFVPAVYAASTVTLTCLLCAQIAKAKIGGQTGDVLGASQVLCQLAALSGFTVFF